MYGMEMMQNRKIRSIITWQGSSENSRCWDRCQVCQWRTCSMEQLCQRFVVSWQSFTLCRRYTEVDRTRRVKQDSKIGKYKLDLTITVDNLTCVPFTSLVVLPWFVELLQALQDGNTPHKFIRPTIVGVWYTFEGWFWNLSAKLKGGALSSRGLPTKTGPKYKDWNWAVVTTHKNKIQEENTCDNKKGNTEENTLTSRTVALARDSTRNPCETIRTTEGNQIWKIVDKTSADNRINYCPSVSVTGLKKHLWYKVQILLLGHQVYLWDWGRNQSHNLALRTKVKSKWSQGSSLSESSWRIKRKYCWTRIVL